MNTFRLFITALFLLFLFSGGSIQAQQSRFDDATRQLNEQQFDEAYRIYRSIESDGLVSGKLYYNLGLTALRLDSLGLAKYYFLQAGAYPDVTNDAGSAIAYVDNRFNRRSAVLPQLPWERLLQWLAATFGAAGVLGGGLILLNLGAGSVIASWFTGRFNSLLRKGGVGTIGLALLLISTSLLIQYRDSRYDTGVMVESEAVVHEMPATESATINTAYEGYTMTIDLKRSSEAPGWWYVRLENGMYGWIRRENVRSFS